jgi:D-arabinose 1-dehydrogenase-like Zn-dependent alcohol dehydrogenase
MDGGWAEYVAGFARRVVKVPDAWTLWTPPLSCAGVTVADVKQGAPVVEWYGA